ncbi:MAG: cytochrome b [Betaproteobacteria bacterium]|nr:cytochrome b [Betaproteobacteria bacterium]
MNWKNTKSRYGSLSIFFHWLMLLLMVAVYAAMELKSFAAKGSALRDSMATWHFMLGLSIFLLVWLRVLVNLTGTRPIIEPPGSVWQERIALLGHLALYGLMIALPLLGWLILSAKGKPVPFFGFELPALMGQSKPYASLFKEAHEVIATAGYFLIGLHAAAALHHHYIKHDNTLTMMLPWRRRA